MIRWAQCYDCKGLGKVDNKVCPTCEGKLYVAVEVTNYEKATDQYEQQLLRRTEQEWRKEYQGEFIDEQNT